MKENPLDELAEQESEAEKFLCIVRVATTAWHDKRGLHQRKSVLVLKRRCTGYGSELLKEDAANIGAGIVMDKITNLNQVDDGFYKLTTCNERRDWETNTVDDYDYQLLPL